MALHIEFDGERSLGNALAEVLNLFKEGNMEFAKNNDDFNFKYMVHEDFEVEEINKPETIEIPVIYEIPVSYKIEGNKTTVTIASRLNYEK